MNAISAIGAAVIFGCGFYLMLKAGLVNRVLGLLLVSHGANYVLILMAGMAAGPLPPLIPEGAGERLANPLPQALILTALVIGFAISAFLWALVLRLGKETE